METNKKDKKRRTRIYSIENNWEDTKRVDFVRINQSRDLFSQTSSFVLFGPARRELHAEPLAVRRSPIMYDNSEKIEDVEKEEQQQ